jgi:hypothetical protein
MGLGVVGSAAGVVAGGDGSVEAGAPVLDGVGLVELPEPDAGLVGATGGLVAGGLQGGVPAVEVGLADPSEPDAAGTEVLVEVGLVEAPGSPATGVVGVVLDVVGQAAGGAKFGAAPKKATRSVEMLEGWPSVT